MEDKTTFSCVLCTVLLALPQNGLAIVHQGTGKTEGLGDTLVAYLPQSDRAAGSGCMLSVKPGDHVLCALDPIVRSRCFIICQANWQDKDRTLGAAGSRWYNASSYSASQGDAVYSALENFASLMADGDKSIADRGTGADMDALPGDTFISDGDTGAGLFVGRMLAALRGSPVAYIEASAIDNCINGLAESIVVHTFGTETAEYADMRVSNTAASPGEALGSRYGMPSVVQAQIDTEADSGTAAEIVLNPSADAALPFYRMQSIEGGPVDGRESIVVGFPRSDKGELLDSHTPATEPPVLSRRRDSMSGELSDASAYGISLVKTPYVPAILQKGYGETVTDEYAEYEAAFPELRRPYVRKQKEKDEAEKEEHSDEEIAMDAAINKLLDTMLSSDYVDKLLAVLAARGLKVSSESKSLCYKEGRIAQRGGSTNEQSYGLPESVEVDDPVTGEKRKYYSAASFITQEPNGDILISDGSGSEIRMSQGNIYISPALDLFLRPGRDLSVMAGRHQAYNSQDTCTISTSTGMYVKSGTDMRIAGAMDDKTGTSVVTLESGGDVAGTGVTIRSKTATSIYGGDVTIARTLQEPSDDSSSNAGKQGAIVIDAGDSGSLYMSSKYTSTVSDEVTLLAGREGGENASLISLQPARVRIGSRLADIYAQRLTADNWLLPATVSVASAGGAVANVKVGPDTQQETANSGSADAQKTASTCDFVLSGNALVHKSCVVNESLIVCESGAIKNLGTASGAVGKTRDSGKVINDDGSETEINVYKKQELVPTDTRFTAGHNAAELTKANLSWAYDYLEKHRFWYPDYGIPVARKIPGMRWQAWYKLEDSERQGSRDSRAWKELPVQDAEDKDTYPYPGTATWKEGKVTYPGYEMFSIAEQDGYITNVPKTKGEETNG